MKRPIRFGAVDVEILTKYADRQRKRLKKCFGKRDGEKKTGKPYARNARGAVNEDGTADKEDRKKQLAR